MSYSLCWEFNNRLYINYIPVNVVIVLVVGGLVGRPSKIFVLEKLLITFLLINSLEF